MKKIITDGKGNTHNLKSSDSFKIDFKYDKKGKYSGEKLSINGEKVYYGNKPNGVNYDKE